MTRILDAILSRMSAWHHQREAWKRLDANIRAAMAEDARERRRDARAGDMCQGEWD